jgi:hypothetical protein
MFNCKFCNKEAKNKNSLAQHEIRCKENPNRIIKVSPFKGKKHNKETIEKCRLAAINQHKNGLGKIPPSFKGKTHSNKTKKKISKALMGNQNANHRGDRQSYYKNIRMDSSWEVKTANYFDNNKINWKYNEKGFLLSDGRYYYPDFFIYDKNNIFLKLIEVKGYFREENRKKFEQFKNEYPNIIIELWDKKILKENNII